MTDDGLHTGISTETARPQHLSSYDVFLLALIAYSTLNLVLLILPLRTYQTRVVLIMDAVIGLLFLLDFIYRLLTAPVKKRYLFREYGWLDLLAGFPLPGLRLAKLIRLRPAMGKWREQGLIGALHRTSSNRATVALLIAIFCTFLVVQFGSMLVIGPEQKTEGSNIHTAEEAIWWSYVTITTVGYGDYYPVSPEGRIVGILLLSLGIALFGVITGFLANAFINPRKERLMDRERQASHQQAMDDLGSGVEALRRELQTLSEDVRRLSNEMNERKGG